MCPQPAGSGRRGRRCACRARGGAGRKRSLPAQPSPGAAGGGGGRCRAGAAGAGARRSAAAGWGWLPEAGGEGGRGLVFTFRSLSAPLLLLSLPSSLLCRGPSGAAGCGLPLPRSRRCPRRGGRGQRGAEVKAGSGPPPPGRLRSGEQWGEAAGTGAGFRRPPPGTAAVCPAPAAPGDGDT